MFEGVRKTTAGLLTLIAGAPLGLLLWIRIASSGPLPAPAAEVAQSGPAPVTTEIAAAQAAPSDYCMNRFLGPLETLAGASPAKPEAEPGAPAPTWRARVREARAQLDAALRDGKGSVKITALIATIPDPLDSGLGYQFETMLQALRRGAEFASTGKTKIPAFYRDRSWLPWDDRELPASERKASAECRRTLPGIMLFRGGAPEAPELLALLLVGESATTGLRRAAMLNALDAYEQLTGGSRGAPGEPHVVRIVGPSFSGSAQSLRRALQSWAPEQQQARLDFEVISGTATGSEVPRWLGTTNPSLGERRTLSFQATTVPEAIIQCAYLRFLHRRLNVPPDGPDPRPDELQQGRPLAGVATLSEMGTEFGATASASDCRWAPASRFHFPFHVSALRDAYEDLDREASTRKDSAIARATSLPVSLREAQLPLDVESSPSPKTRTADDLALGAVLEQISLQRIKHLAIHATDVGDAIFLARRIRDVVPDVRLAFFESDALLLHPDFRRELLGSLVVSPYPFLGLSEFERGASDAGQLTRSFHGFDNGHAQGVYNALLAQRGAEAALLSDYSIGSKSPLPVWIATVGRHSLVPLKVGSTPDCAGTLYDAAPHGNIGESAFAELCAPGEDRDARKAFATANEEPLALSASSKLPYVWDILFALLCVAFAVDHSRQKAGARRLSRVRFPEPASYGTDQTLDRAMGRTKWRFYSVVRSFLFLLAFTYIGSLYALNLIARQAHLPLWSLGARELASLWDLGLLLVGGAFVLTAFGASAYCTAVAALRFARDYRAFGAWLGAHLVPRSWSDLREAFYLRPGEVQPLAAEAAAPDSERDSAPPSSAFMTDRITLGIATARAAGQTGAGRLSFAQLRLLTALSTFIALAFVVMLVADTWVAADLSDTFYNLQVDRRLPLTVMRNAALTSGVSPATPALLCMACVYVWAVGRMARLALAHSISRVSPPDGESDLVSTPIRTILHPSYTRQRESDAGFTEVERHLLETIWRPIRGRYYPAAAAGVAFVPLVLFCLKPPSTLESVWGTLFLSSGLALSLFLIGITLVQLIQYWTALRQLLRRLMEHPIGSAFRDVPSFARDSVDHQLSRSPDEALRWSACAVMFSDLMRSSSATGDFALLEPHLDVLTARAQKLSTLRDAALGGPPPREHAPVTSEDASATDDTPALALRREQHVTALQVKLEAKLAQHVIETAGEVTRLLEKAWAMSAHDETRRAIPAAKAAATPVAVVHVIRGSLLPPPMPEDPTMPESGETAPSSGRKPSAVPESGPGDALSPAAPNFSSAQLPWLRAAQRFVATVTTLLVHRHVRQFRYFLHVTTLCALLLLLAIASYPFQPYRLLLTFIWIVMASVVGVSLWVFIQMDRNTFLSHVSGTTPDTVTFNGAFALRLLAWAVVPLLSVAAAQYPDLSNVLFRVIEPFARAFQ